MKKLSVWFILFALLNISTVFGQTDINNQTRTEQNKGELIKTQDPIKKVPNKQLTKQQRKQKMQNKQHLNQQKMQKAARKNAVLRKVRTGRH